MTLPRVYALFRHWRKYPPTHIAMTLAWLKPEEDSTDTKFDESKFDEKNLPQNREADASAFFNNASVQGSWSGPPPVTPADVIRLAEKARRPNG